MRAGGGDWDDRHCRSRFFHLSLPAFLLARLIWSGGLPHDIYRVYYLIIQEGNFVSAWWIRTNF
jgi:hypothetical protein